MNLSRHPTTRRLAGAVALGVVIALTTAGLSWNSARVAPRPEPAGDRLVTMQKLGWGDLYLPAGHDTLPALLFSPGLGVEVSAYGTFLTDLASHGFIVVAIPYPSIKIEDNADFLPALPKIANGLTAALDQINSVDSLRSRIDSARVAAIGHSFGGGAAALACTDPRIKAAVDFDGSLYGSVVHEGVRCPFLLIEQSLSRADTIDTPVFHEERSQGRLHEDSLIAHSKLVEWVTIDGLDHMSFTDPGLAFVSSNWMKETVSLRMNAAVSQRLTAGIALDFLRRQLGAKVYGAQFADRLPKNVHRATKR